MLHWISVPVHLFLLAPCHQLLATTTSWPQVINLDLLDALGASRGTEDLKEEIKVQVGGLWEQVSKA